MMNPRARVLELVEEGLLDTNYLLNALLGYLSWDEVREMCEMNEIELSPEDEEEEEEVK